MNKIVTSGDPAISAEVEFTVEFYDFNTAGKIATKAVSTQMAFDIEKNDSCFVCPRIFTDKVEQLIAERAGTAGKSAGSRV